MSSFKIFSDEDVRKRVDMATAIDLMHDAFIQISKRSAQVPIRATLDTVDKRGRVLFMPAYSPSFHLFGLKMVSVFPENVKKEIPAIQGKMLVMDDVSGAPLGLIDAEYLTALRTGAASGVATDLLAASDSKVLAIFGTGAQSITQVAAILEVRAIKEILVFGSSSTKSQSFCNYLNKTYSIDSKVGNQKDLNRADVICTATTSAEPLFLLDQLKPGVHINGIGSYKPSIREIDDQVIKASTLIVDQREAALSEAGDVVMPINKGIITADHIYAELGELLTGDKKVKTDQTTVFKSVGNAVQDLAVASYLLK